MTFRRLDVKENEKETFMPIFKHCLLYFKYKLMTLKTKISSFLCLTETSRHDEEWHFLWNLCAVGSILNKLLAHPFCPITFWHIKTKSYLRIFTEEILFSFTNEIRKKNSVNKIIFYHKNNICLHKRQSFDR